MYGIFDVVGGCCRRSLRLRIFSIYNSLSMSFFRFSYQKSSVSTLRQIVSVLGDERFVVFYVSLFILVRFDLAIALTNLYHKHFKSFSRKTLYSIICSRTFSFLHMKIPSLF
ncbi:hypothetical protein NY2A_b501R [Paramecium bursaria Chlorella virus NY2A]|uniref:Uncharacterized protein b501R n=1 Tax=Paramecium bursaria Chlorella virus NY2A TaxID=46021 RepID=A7IX26_PBCVN|nr:hypothetical protein NY2A_b501R [Paramecium bursaria Chlorella virus NY2A]YP_001498523.1 hypothetical protein AR158_c442R [Paramecium bursaria Chlorella virus AR158]ABT14900.1 hypothetical protein NY2A_b501R [Paramecium bursaria Chlorella virus NY2A]ABU43987.1 hypothetical protein AR158_c442R [Paramecium bursaria Chlorella virus AR158]